MVLKRIFLHYLPVCLWMILIFYLSSQQKISVSSTYIINFILFKSLHVIEYAILYYLWLWAISTKKTVFDRQTHLWAGIAALLYAIFDEIHQTFVPTREGKIRDICIDGIGITIGITIMYIITKQNTVKYHIKKLWR